MAESLPAREFVFLGVGFETTAPTVAAACVAARASRARNFTVLPLFKLIPPALAVIAGSKQTRIHGFILPGHVSTIIGTGPYEFLSRQYRLPACIVGFEALDILQGIHMLLSLMTTGPAVTIQYRRSVRPEGNPAALSVMNDVFGACDASWRGIGTIPGSGLEFRAPYSRFDARSRFALKVPAPKPTACRCGEVMLGLIVPPDCRLFGNKCTPENPVGPCMVSSEGACAAYYKYDR
jgi:hydrogenase expression/formation protein HypD